MQPSILEINPLLDFYETINLTTGEMKTTNRNGNKVTPSKNASYKGLEFKIVFFMKKSIAKDSLG